MESHRLHAELLERDVRVLVVGCGGTGSAILGGLPYLHQAMLAQGHPYGLCVTVMDGDIVSVLNCVRQPFSRSEIGLNKAIVLVNRINLFWGLDWQAIPQALTAQTLAPSHTGYGEPHLRPDIVVEVLDYGTFPAQPACYRAAAWWIWTGRQVPSGSTEMRFNPFKRSKRLSPLRSTNSRHCRKWCARTRAHRMLRLTGAKSAAVTAADAINFNLVGPDAA